MNHDSRPDAAALRRSRELWVGFTAGTSILVCCSVVLMYLLQSAAFNRAADLARELRQARIDLSQGFMHAMLGSAPDSPWDGARGPVLMEQGIREFRGVLPSVPGANVSRQDMEQALRTLQAVLARGSPDDRDLIELRVAFHQLNQQASEIDLHAKHELDRLQRRHAVTFWIVLAGCSLLLAAVNIGAARAAQRERTAVQGQREADMKFALLADNIDDVFWLRDPSTNEVLYVNAAARELWGRPPQELLRDPDTWTQALHPDDRPGIAERVAARPAESIDMEYRIVRPDGSIRWIHDRAFPVSDDGLGVSVVVGIAEDITVRKQHQLEQLKTLTLLEAVLQSTDNGVMAAGPEGQVLLWNERLVQLLGGVAPRRGGGEAAVLQAIGMGGAGRPQRSELPVVAGPTGAWLEAHGQPMIVEGSPGGRVWTFRDVTARENALVEAQSRERELEERVDARTRELAETCRQLDAFTGAVSHDLGAPLAAIRAFTEVVLRKHAQGLDPKGRHYVERALAASEGMRRMIDGLLELARHSRAPVNRRPLDISRMAREAHAMLAHAYAGHQVEFSVQAGLRASGDAALVATLLQNLIGNALKYSRDRSPARIEVGRALERGEEHFFVRDNGAGFDPAYGDRLFQPFSRLHSSEEFDGHGIGLATTSRIVSRHGGSIWAEGAVGRGAIFRFTLGKPGEEGPAR